MADVKGYALLIVAILLIPVSCCIVHIDEDKVLTATVTGEGPYESLCLDISMDDLRSIGADYGSTAYVSIDGRTHRCTLTMNWNGTPAYSLYITHDVPTGNILFGIYNGQITKETDLAAGSKISIRYAGHSGYLDKIPNYIRGYSHERDDYPSDTAFAVFRSLDEGDIIRNTYYRSCSPWSCGNRSVYSDGLYEQNGVENLMCIDMDLNGAAALAATFPDRYASELFREGKVQAMKMDPALHSHPDQIRWLLETIYDTDGTVGIFCKYGKDRTGTCSAILEALAGASYEEIRKDFMRSMCEYYGITEGSEEYETVAWMYVDRVLYLFEHYEIIGNYLDMDWDDMPHTVYDAENTITEFLVSYIGLDPGFVKNVKDKLTGNGPK